ncbi:MAG: ABC transporter ATP-binding protein [Phycisphaerales bacterium]
MNPPQAPIEIRVEELHKQFDERPVLRGVNLTIRRGEIVAILGASGGGKTVLLQHLIGHYQPDAGRVLIADHDATSGQPREPGRAAPETIDRASAPLVDLATLDCDAMDRLRHHWAVVFQPNALFTGSVYENIALWMREVKLMAESQIRPRVENALKAVGLDPGAVMERDRSKLSGGMAKRVAIARAIAMQPRLIFYDEPTTGLDPSMATQIHDLIQRMHEEEGTEGIRDKGNKGMRELGNEGMRDDASNGSASSSQSLNPLIPQSLSSAPRTSVIITHDTQLLRRLGPRVVLLHEGRVVFDGPYAEFRDKAADMSVVRPYIEQMPSLQLRSVPHA